MWAVLIMLLFLQMTSCSQARQLSGGSKAKAPPRIRHSTAYLRRVLRQRSRIRPAAIKAEDVSRINDMDLYDAREHAAKSGSGLREVYDARLPWGYLRVGQESLFNLRG